MLGLPVFGQPVGPVLGLPVRLVAWSASQLLGHGATMGSRGTGTVEVHHCRGIRRRLSAAVLEVCSAGPVVSLAAPASGACVCVCVCVCVAASASYVE